MPLRCELISLLAYFILNTPFFEEYGSWTWDRVHFGFQRPSGCLRIWRNPRPGRWRWILYFSQWPCGSVSDSRPTTFKKDGLYSRNMRYSVYVLLKHIGSSNSRNISRKGRYKEINDALALLSLVSVYVDVSNHWSICYHNVADEGQQQTGVASDRPE